MGVIGISLPLTVSESFNSDVAAVARDLLNTFEFAQSRLCSNHQLKVRDNGYTSELVRQHMSEFSDSGVDLVLGLPMSLEAKAAGIELQSTRIPILTPMATSPELAKFSNVFCTRPSDGYAAKPLVQHVLDNGWRSLLAVSDDTDYALDCTVQVVKEAQAKELEVIEEICPVASLQSLSTLSVADSSKPDVVFVNSHNEEGLFQILSQVSQSFPDLPVIGAAMPSSKKFQDLAGELASGMVYADEPVLSDSITELGRQELFAFKERYGPLGTWDDAFLSSYTAFNVAHALLEQGGDLLSRLQVEEFDDPINGPFKFEENERRSYGTHRLRTI